METKNKLYKRNILLLIILVGIVISSAVLVYANEYLSISKPSGKTPAIKKEVATKAAQDVFGAMNPNSRLTSIVLKERLPNNQLLWEAFSDKDSEIWVNANNGEIRFLFDGENSADRVDYAKNKFPAISREQALSSIAQAAGKLKLEVPSTKPDNAEMVNHSDNEGEPYEWNFKWAREKQGYKYHDDWVFISVDAYKGQIIGYNQNFASNEPTSLEIRIEKPEALELAGRLASKEGFSLIQNEAELMIVNPNYRWTEYMTKVPEANTRLAWVIVFDKPQAPFGGSGEIWIDASNGKMLGGVETR